MCWRPNHVHTKLVKCDWSNWQLLVFLCVPCRDANRTAQSRCWNGGSSSSSKKITVFEINGILLAIKRCPEVEPQSCISWLSHQLLSSVGSARDPPSGRDGAGGWLGRSVGAAGQIAISWRTAAPGSRGTSVCGGYESCGKKAEGKGSNREKRAAEWNQKSDSLLKYFRILKLLNSLILPANISTSLK